MRWTVMVSGWAALISVLVAAPAVAQDWTIALDVPVGIGFRTSNEGTVTDFGTEGLEGFILSVTTPYHVGFAYESETVFIFPEADDKDFRFRYRVQFINVFAEIPILGANSLVFSPGIGWGTGKIDNPDGGSDDDTNLEPVNLWQFYATLALGLPWGLQARLGYHEARGTVVNRDRTQTPLKANASPLQTSLTTIGIGYTF